MACGERNIYIYPSTFIYIYTVNTPSERYICKLLHSCGEYIHVRIYIQKVRYWTKVFSIVSRLAGV